MEKTKSTKKSAKKVRFSRMSVANHPARVSGRGRSDEYPKEIAALRPAQGQFAGCDCGKAGQGVPVGVAQPSILINKMTVGGTKL